MPMYEYLCEDNHLTDEFRKYEDREAPGICETCGRVTRRGWVTPPQVRTEKLSRTFIDGQRSDGLSEEIKAADLDRQAMSHDPKSDKYKELKAEARARRFLNGKKERRNKTRLSKLP